MAGVSEASVMQAVLSAFNAFQSTAPIRTGNLRYNATRLESKGNGEWVIKVDGNIAPYAPFTNEPWVSPRWRGKSNPNEGWIDDGAYLVAAIIGQSLGGTVVQR